MRALRPTGAARSWLLATVLLAAVVGAGYLVVPVGEARIGQATCDRIQIGWTHSQVEELLGNKPFSGSLVVLGAFWKDEDDNHLCPLRARRLRRDEQAISFERTCRSRTHQTPNRAPHPSYLARASCSRERCAVGRQAQPCKNHLGEAGFGDPCCWWSWVSATC
jgi:hypothetical protein